MTACCFRRLLSAPPDHAANPDRESKLQDEADENQDKRAGQDHFTFR